MANPIGITIKTKYITLTCHSTLDLLLGTNLSRNQTRFMDYRA